MQCTVFLEEQYYTRWSRGVIKEGFVGEWLFPVLLGWVVSGEELLRERHKLAIRYYSYYHHEVLDVGLVFWAFGILFF